jgi:hypothetical protein
MLPTASVKSLLLRAGLALSLVFCLHSCALAQSESAAKEKDRANAGSNANATLTFTLDFPGSDPSHYRLSVSSDGHATYDSDGKLTPESEGDPFHAAFSISEPTRARIFDLAKRANYFQGDVDSHKRNLASTGTKTLAYKDAQHNTQASYNYSPLPPVQELTQLLQNLSTTLEFGQRLAYYHRYQKLALDDELKRMEEMSKQNSLGELQAIAPILQQIVSDTSLITPVRSRAQRLLVQATAAPSH